MLVTRTCKLAIYPNQGKLELLAYAHNRFMLYVQHFVTQLYFNHHKKFFSTEGMSTLANQAQKTACDLLRAHREATKETGNKSNLPQIKNAGMPVVVEFSADSKFDVWCKIEDRFKKNGRELVPAKSHKRLNNWLRSGWLLNKVGNISKDKNGKFYLIVFVQKEVAKAIPEPDALGVDVGVTHSVSRSDGYLGRGLKELLTKNRDKNAERRRQNHFTKSVKTSVKQALDVEAKRVVARCKALRKSLAFENPKLLANLQPRGRIAAWARSYFANRVSIIAQEESVFCVAVRPSYTSQTCAFCGHRDRSSRVKSVFNCTACENRTHADINAARVIAQKGSVVSRNFCLKR